MSIWSSSLFHVNLVGASFWCSGLRMASRVPLASLLGPVTGRTERACARGLLLVGGGCGFALQA